MKHGTKYSYDQGCRCDDCRTAAVAIRHKKRDRARAEKRPSYYRELATSRRLKESYRGRCRECGAPTTGCDGPSSARELCYRCSPGIVGKRLRGTGPIQRRTLAFLKTERRYSEIRDHLQITDSHASVHLHQLVKYGLIERTRRGYYRAKEISRS